MTAEPPVPPPHPAPGEAGSVPTAEPGSQDAGAGAPPPPPPPPHLTQPTYEQPSEPGPQAGGPWPPAAAPPATPAPSPGQPPVPAETDKVSVTAFVLSLFGIGIAAIPLGIWGIVRTSRGARRGRGFAIGALVVSVVWGVVATVAVAAFLQSGVVEQLEAVASSAVASATAPPATEDGAAETSEPVAGSESVYWQDVEPGMCISASEETDVFDLVVVDCTAAHQAEVIALTSLPGTTTYPGDDAVEKAVLDACLPEFESYVGLPFDTSRLDLDYISTDQEGWESGDRTLVCLLYDPEQELATQSFKGSKE